MKKFIAALLILTFMLTLAPTAFAADNDEARVVLGADLTEAQITEVYNYFGIARGSVTELTVTNAEERQYLSGIAPESQIGTFSLSCIYIKVLDKGAGIGISTNNINWCTSDMYTAALLTAGITGAEVKITSPFSVSGTAALTGIYKAYESITGKTINEDAKTTSIEELVLTGNLSEAIGSEQATELIAQLKEILDQTETMTDDEVRVQIHAIADSIGVVLTDEQVEQILGLVRKFEKLDVKELQENLQKIVAAAEKTKQAAEKVSQFGQKVVDFFAKVGDFFSKLFGGKKE